jgi:MOSC domain-containing protein YiiM
MINPGQAFADLSTADQEVESMRGTILNVCVSARKGTPKRAVERVFLRRDHGLDGDAHAGPWHRQVSLLDADDISDMKAKGLTLKPGAFGENVVISGLDTRHLGIGSRLRLGEAEVEITQIGKVCHSRCAIYYQAGDCIMPRHGLFASVTRDGAVHAGTAAEVLHSLPRATVQAAVLAPAGREKAEDATAAILQAELGAHIAWRGQAPGPTDETIALLRQLCGRGLDLVVVLASDVPAGSTLREAVRSVMDGPCRVSGNKSMIYGIGAGAVLVVSRGPDGADALRSSAPRLDIAIVELRRARAAENGSQSTDLIVPRVRITNNTPRA